MGCLGYKGLDENGEKQAFISDNDEQLPNIYTKLLHSETFHFFKGEISANDEQPKNVRSKFSQ